VASEGNAHDLTAARKKATQLACEASGVSPDDIVEPAFSEFASWRSSVDDLLFPDVTQALLSLQQNHPTVQLCAVTNGNSDISQTALSPVLSFSVRSEDVGAKKPDPLPFLKACELAGCLPEECLFVGDNPVDDVAGAQALGMRTVWVNRKETTWHEQADGVPHGVTPDAEVTSLAQLVSLVTSWNAEAALAD
jgi:putative hydrolase of the HAD superfamily